MKVLEFDIQKGLYHFEMEELRSNSHAHPVLECVWTNEGSFSLEQAGTISSNLQLAIISANLPHKLASDSKVQLLLLKAHNDKLERFLLSRGIELNQGIFTAHNSEEYPELLAEIKAFALNTDLHETEDVRVNACLKLLEAENLAYEDMNKKLASHIFLSESRISHLFTERVGLSLKKYLLWVKLKRAIAHLLDEQNGLTDAAYQSGFYDQAHFSKVFKQMLGMPPSQAYNSRSLQFIHPNSD